MQIYAEAESNANSFALPCLVRKNRGALDSQGRRAEHAMQAVRLALPRRHRISAAGKYTQKPRAMQIHLHCHVLSVRGRASWPRGAASGAQACFLIVKSTVTPPIKVPVRAYGRKPRPPSPERTEEEIRKWLKTRDVLSHYTKPYQSRLLPVMDIPQRIRNAFEEHAVSLSVFTDHACFHPPLGF